MGAPEFDVVRMERFLKEDLFARMLFEGLEGGTRAAQLEAFFNSIVLEGSIMTRSYKNA